jgi:AbrB family looped-hinge helix DNA binding protein
METVTVSPKYQVVIPEELRRNGRIRPGDKMAAIMKHGILYFVPVRPLSKTKGMILGLNTHHLRDESDQV